MNDYGIVYDQKILNKQSVINFFATNPEHINRFLLDYRRLSRLHALVFEENI